MKSFPQLPLVPALTELMNDLNFVVNVAKCAVMIFGDKTKAEFRIDFDGLDMRVVKHHKYLGIYIDDKLNFKRHVNEVQDNTMKRTNILKYLDGIRWGGHPSTLRMVYKAAAFMMWLQAGTSTLWTKYRTAV
jgi:hypothetical protein